MDGPRYQDEQVARYPLRSRGKGICCSLFGWKVEHHKAGRVGSRHHNIRPSIAIQVAWRHAVDRSLAVAKWHRLILPSRSIVEIDHSRSVNIADNDFRPAVAIQICGNHGIRNRLRRVESNALAKIAFAVIEVHKTAHVLVPSGDVQLAVTVKVGNRHRAGG